MVLGGAGCKGGSAGCDCLLNPSSAASCKCCTSLVVGPCAGSEDPPGGPQPGRGGVPHHPPCHHHPCGHVPRRAPGHTIDPCCCGQFYDMHSTRRRLELHVCAILSILLCKDRPVQSHMLLLERAAFGCEAVPEHACQNIGHEPCSVQQLLSLHC